MPLELSTDDRKRVIRALQADITRQHRAIESTGDYGLREQLQPELTATRELLRTVRSSAGYVFTVSSRHSGAAFATDVTAEQAAEWMRDYERFQTIEQLAELLRKLTPGACWTSHEDARGILVRRRSN